MAQKHNGVSSEFFKTWSHQMAYVLGYFAADGTMIANKNGGHYIEFHSTDKCLIEMVRKVMRLEQKIGIRMPKPGSKHKIAYRIQIGNRGMFADLLHLGFTQNKSSNLILPIIPEPYTADFVRGYFDGDGCVYFKRLKFADRRKSRFILMSLFTSGSRGFLGDLHTLLRKYEVRGGSLKEKTGGFELAFSF